MRTATSASPKRRKRLRLALAVGAILALCAIPTASSKTAAGAESGELRVRSTVFSDGSVTTISLQSSASLGRVAIFVPQGYTLDLGRPVSASIGEVALFVRDATGGFGDFASGELVVDDPAKYQNDASAQACAPGLHSAVWRASLGARGRTLELAVFLDPTSSLDPTGTAYALRLCPVWPSTTVGVAHLIADGLLFFIDQAVAIPAAANRYTWSALVTPTAAGSLDPQPSRTFEVRSVVPLPRTLTLRAKHDAKARSVVLSGKLTSAGQPEAGIPISFSGHRSSADDEDIHFGPVNTNTAGEFSIRRRIAHTTEFEATAEAEPGICTAPSSAPGGCVSETVTPPLPARAAVVLRKRTDPKLAVRRVDRARAREANLKSRDFPPGWVSLPLLTPLELCPRFAPNLSALTATGEARSPIFLTETTAAASRSTIYSTEDQASAAFGKEAVRAIPDCIADDARDEGGATVHSVGPLSFPQLGEQTRAFRIVVEEGDTITYLDLVSFRSGRTVVHLVFSAVGVPLDIEHSLAATVAARARAR